jgi:hypothetical protein
LDPCSKKAWAKDNYIISIFKPNAPLANTTEDLGKLGKDLTKQDHIVIVGVDRNDNYCIQKDIN